MKQIHAPHSHGLRHLGHFPLPPLYAASAAHPSGKAFYSHSTYFRHTESRPAISDFDV